MTQSNQDDSALAAELPEFARSESFQLAMRNRCQEVVEQASTDYLGLAPFLEISTHLGNLAGVVQALLEKANVDQDNPVLWLNLATAMFSFGQRDLGLVIQSQAVSMKSLYTLKSAQPARLKVLLLVAEGDLSDNTPLDCLVDGGHIELLVLYVDGALPERVRGLPHDVLMVGLSETEANQPILNKLSETLNDWPKPVVNRPEAIFNVERMRASELLQGVDGLEMPLTHKVPRTVVQGSAVLGEASEFWPEECTLPFIIRPVGSHAGKNLELIDDWSLLNEYLLQVSASRFYVSRFVDYRNEQGLFGKIRLAVMGGEVYPAHMALSENWMIHYLNAGMYENASRREAEHQFMKTFDEFKRRHAQALQAIYSRCGLEYLCIDCAETQDGKLLVFEVDHSMVVHAKDPVDLFPYKQTYMRQVREAFERYIGSLVNQAEA